MMTAPASRIPQMNYCTSSCFQGAKRCHMDASRCKTGVAPHGHAKMPQANAGATAANLPGTVPQRTVVCVTLPVFNLLC